MVRKDIIDTEMKTPAENARAFFSTLCVGFTVVMAIAMVFGSIFAGEEARQGINYCWSLFAACGLAAALQLVFFTPVLIKRMGYPARLFSFGACLYAALAAFAVAFQWFPIGMAGAWASFTTVYLVMLAAATAVFATIQRREERRLNESLAEYRKNVE